MKTLLSNLALTFILSLSLQFADAQSVSISGIVYSRIGKEVLAGAEIYQENGLKGSISDNAGKFTFEIHNAKENILVSYLGYKTHIILPSEYSNSSFIEVYMEQDLIAFNEGVVIVGSRNEYRTSLSSPVPVDRFPSSVLDQTGQTDISQQINSLAPSFYSSRLTYSDATDHMDPAALRGLNPDQTLILVNGKRHHPSAIVNTLGVVGRGSVINDLNTIPSAAISRIEILRDGASAQYGSDAIAGVINIVLKSDTSAIHLKSSIGQFYAGDGFERNISANYGIGLKNGGYLNLTTAFTRRGGTNRTGTYEGLVYRYADELGLNYNENLSLDNAMIASRGLNRQDFNLHLGNSALSNASVYLNSVLPLNSNSEFYLFGGMNYRYSMSAGDYRLPSDTSRNNRSIYPDGFLPLINAQLGDKFLSAGLRGKINKWDVDLSNTFGSNRMDFYVENSLNASMGDDSPLSFESGGIAFMQNTVNLDFNRKLKDVGFIETVSFAFGGEFRLENYKIKAGEQDSWINEDQISYPGAQGFPGYQPVDEVDKSRSNAGFYTDISVNISRNFLIELAGRYEEYSDFGNKLSGKLSSRYSLTPWLNLRGSASTGFRAPSLHQSYYSNTGSYYYFGSLFEVLTANNESRVTSAFGIPKLKEENSVSLSFGMNTKPFKNTNLAIDLYQITVNDRIVLSSTFWSFYPSIATLLEDLPGVGGAQFFTNAIDTRTRGLDIIFTQQFNLSSSQLGISIAANLNQTKVIGDIKAGKELIDNGIEGFLFDRQAKALIELAQPRSKVAGTITYSRKKLDLTFRNILYGQVSYRGIDESAEELAKDQDYSPKLLSDLKFEFHLTKNLSVNLGANNVFDVYPDENTEALRHFGRFPYNTAVTQFGFNGGYYYGGLTLEL